MRRVIVESPYAGDIIRNEAYARACIKDCLNRGEAPFASHVLYTLESILDDSVPEQRALGMEAGFAWGSVADATIVYLDLGMSSGMQEGITRASKEGRLVEFRFLYEKGRAE
jgi:hypothetical protein